MSPQSRARVSTMVRQAEAEMLLSELRRHAEMTQADVAKALGIQQPRISRLESADEDMQISTLSRLVRALGGELEVFVTLPNLGRVRLSQFS
ncbi:MAG: helix-turn-helix transcriptional regulator [Phycisphaerae bacterium]|nr:helix-turn-helix transcriptional regulator [Phycisphaerae bacterium]